MAAAQAGAPLPAHRVDLVDEHHGRGAFLGGAEQIPHPAGAHAHEHLHKVGTRNGEERCACFPGHSLGQQGLTGARRAHQQHALGDPGAHLREALGGAHKLHHFPQLFLFLVRAGHVGKGDLFARVHLGAGPALAEVHHAVAAALGTEHEIIQHRQRADHEHIGKQPFPDGGLGGGVGHGFHGEVRVGHLIPGDALELLGKDGHILPVSFQGGDVGIEIILGRESFLGQFAIDV